MEGINYKKLTLQSLNQIKALWEALNIIHGEDSIFFKDHYSVFTFEKRNAHWKTMSEEDILILVAEDINRRLIGYCISTINVMKHGEIDSLYVDPCSRGNGVGKALVEQSLKWLQSNQCNPIRLNVSYGHENVLEFYQKVGFYPRMTVLEYKNNNKKIGI